MALTVGPYHSKAAEMIKQFKYDHPEFRLKRVIYTDKRIAAFVVSWPLLRYELYMSDYRGKTLNRTACQIEARADGKEFLAFRNTKSHKCIAFAKANGTPSLVKGEAAYELNFSFPDLDSYYAESSLVHPSYSKATISSLNSILNQFNVDHPEASIHRVFYNIDYAYIIAKSDDSFKLWQTSDSSGVMVQSPDVISFADRSILIIDASFAMQGFILSQEKIKFWDIKPYIHQRMVTEYHPDNISCIPAPNNLSLGATAAFARQDVQYRSDSSTIISIC